MIRNVELRIPGIGAGAFKISVIHRIKHYEEAIIKDGSPIYVTKIKSILPQ